jgi:Haloacid Dehalogenase superfamily, subfamily IB, phosphoserine phosphatase-like/2,3-diketo-5-methylthio-1-phosphopentane phosphatase
MTQAKERIIFCDFDGTITMNDNIVAVIRHFDPPGWKEIVDDVIAERKSVRRGVGELFRLLPTSRKDEIIDFAVNNVVIRDGFAELIRFCRYEGIEFYVTSGGIDFFVYPILAKYDVPRDRIFCNGSDFSGERVEITWPHPCEPPCANDCGMCKTTIMRRFQPERYERIVIGDSVTDFEAAKMADAVFARSHLTEKCKALGVPHTPYETFHDVIDALEERMGI